MSVKYSALGVLAAAAILPAAALAGHPGSYFNDYEGNLEGDPNAHLGFDVGRLAGERVAHNFDVDNAPFSCYDGTIDRVDVPFPEDNPNASIAISNGHFKGNIASDDGPPVFLKVEGKLLADGAARGVMKIRTRGATDPDNCYSGFLNWRDRGNSD